MQQRPRLLLAEDYPPVAAQLRALLEDEFEVVAVVDDGFALLGAAQALAPDVVVADVEMPGMDGITASEQLLGRSQRRDRAPPTPPAHPMRVVLVTVHNEPALVKRAFEAGVSGYVLKLRAGEELVPAVHAALRGEQYASPLVFGAPT